MGMKLLLLPILAGALLFSGCEATVVERRPHYSYGYERTDRRYYDADRGRDYRRQDNSYYRQGYVSTRPVYVSPARAPYQGSSYDGRSRTISRAQLVTPRAHVKVKAEKGRHSGNKKSKHKDDDRQGR